MAKFIDGIAMSAEYARRKDLVNLFDSQVEILIDRNTPYEIVVALQSQREQVISKASSMVIGERNIPFLPIISPAYIGYHGLVSKIQSKKGYYISIDPALIVDQVQIPNGLYYIYNIESGEFTRGDTPGSVLDLSLSPLTAAEIINLCIVTDVLSKHCVGAVGSRNILNEKIPVIYLDDGGRLILNCFYDDYQDDDFGWPSCGSRG